MCDVRCVWCVILLTKHSKSGTLFRSTLRRPGNEAASTLEEHVPTLRTNFISEELGDVQVAGDLHCCFQLRLRRPKEALQV